MGLMVYDGEGKKGQGFSSKFLVGHILYLYISTRKSNRLKYRSGSGNLGFNGSDSRLFKDLGSGLVRVQNLKVRLRFTDLKY